MTGYWNYFDDDFDWKVESDLFSPNFQETIDKLQATGLTKDQAIILFNSGYVCIEGFDILIDRYYGGAISSIDNRTRFSLESAKELLNQPPCSRTKVEKITSIEHLNSVVESLKGRGRDILFRGQTKNYTIQRKVNNPYLTIDGFGEVSLLPSVWRRMVNVNPQSFTPFTSLSLFEWSSIFYTAFDIPEIERRHEALNKAGENIYTMSAMEDCSDEMLREFGKFRMDLSMGMEHNLRTTLTTLLQHYGLHSPVLDLTESLDVALFFATNKYEKKGDLSTYNFVGSNNGQSVIYVLRYNNEMERHDQRDEFLKYLEPQRPIQQKCVVCRTGEYAINLPNLYLETVLVLDFDFPKEKSKIKTEQIFPGKDTDKFLNSILQKLFRKENITVF